MRLPLKLQCGCSVLAPTLDVGVSVASRRCGTYVEAKISVVGSVENIDRWLIGMTMCASIRKQAMGQWFGEYGSEWRSFSSLHATIHHFQVHTNQIHAIPMIPSPPMPTGRVRTVGEDQRYSFEVDRMICRMFERDSRPG